MHRRADPSDIDRDGYRKNVGIIVCNARGQVLWARRVRRDGWQFPQGGIRPHESPREAAFRELQEEVGLEAGHVRLLGATAKWLRYEVPSAGRNRSARRLLAADRPAGADSRADRAFKGQKQRWFLFELIAAEASVRLDSSAQPEFDRWRWVDYWRPLQQIVAFKRMVYRQALTELAPLVPQVVRAGEDEFQR